MIIDRRKLVHYGLGLAGATALGGRAAAAGAARSAAFTNLHTGESLNATYWEGGAYIPDALAALNHLLRDHRNDEVHAIAPNLFDLISTLRARLETNAVVQVISGYRSPATNAALHARSEGVASHSLHMVGEATDVRIAGVDLARLRDAAWSLQGGGVGFYPQSQFVHVDVGRVRRWAGA
ncbi:MAG TPA: DUF882 domain-containing protein [Phenylobacterium sp.]